MTTTAEILRGLPYFADLSDELIDTVCEESEQQELKAGQVIIQEGTNSEEMYVLVSGELIVTKRGAAEKEVTLARIGPGEVVGEIALLDQAPRTATVKTDTDSVVIRVPAKAFEALLGDSRVVRRMFRTVTGRLRGIEDTLRHEEQMSALGRMAAQLMHELNNPAAAVGRSTKELSRVSDLLGDQAVALARSFGDGADLVRPEPPGRMTPMDRNEAEDLIANWLEEQDVDEAWELAPAMVETGWTTDLLAAAIAPLDDSLSATLVRWIALRAESEQLIGEIGIGASRISELVRIVKEYSYLDQAPVQELDLRQGIEDTLILLKGKLREIEVVTQFDEDLLMVEVPGRDVNQVWTNLIDNAADAMEPGGTLTLSATNLDDSVVVSVADTGSGMDQETTERIFDPFFTTKEPGKGTGLGLHTVHTIITRIGGEITVTSDSSGTTFTVTLPTTPGEVLADPE